MRTSLSRLLAHAVARTALFACSVALAAAADSVPLKKVGEYQLLTGRGGFAAVVQGSAIYVIGGNNKGAVTDIERFDVGTKKSERVYDKLTPRRYHNAIEYQGKIYIFGGQGFGLPSEAVGLEPTVDIFDPATRTMAHGTNMPDPRQHAAAVRLGDKILMTGGAKVKDTHLAQTNETVIYDLGANTWSKGVPMPTPREAPGVLVGSFVMVAGGYRGSARLAEVEFFSPQENAWKSLPALSSKVSSHSMVQLGQYLLLFGDFSELDSVLAYDLSTRKTYKLKPGFQGARHTAAVVHNNVAYVIGGHTNSEGDGSPRIQAFALAP